MPVYKINDRKESCEDCALCCQGWDVPLTEDDLRILPDPSAMAEPDPAGGYAGRMKRVDDVCVALDRTTKRCTIYERRPHACRDFLLGGWECFKKAVAEGWEPEVSEERMAVH